MFNNNKIAASPKTNEGGTGYSGGSCYVLQRGVKGILLFFVMTSYDSTPLQIYICIYRYANIDI